MKNYLKLLVRTMSEGWDETEPVVTIDGQTAEPIRLLHAPQLRFVLGKGFPLMTTRPVDFDTVRDRAFGLLFKSNAETVVKKIQDNTASCNTLTHESGGPLGAGEPERCQFTTEQNVIHCALTLDTINIVSDLPELIATYAIIVRLLARESIGKYDGELVVNIGRAVICHRHFDAVNCQINRRPMKLCELAFNPDRSSFKDSTSEDLTIEDYLHWDSIKITK